MTFDHVMGADEVPGNPMIPLGFLVAGLLVGLLAVTVLVSRRRRRRAVAAQPHLAATRTAPTAPPPTAVRPQPAPAPTAAATVPDSRGVTLSGGRFTPLEELGRGGMGIVWRASDNVLGREVAIKQILPPSALTPDAAATLRARMLREARAAAQLDHPNAVTVHDVVIDQDSVLIVMELVRAVPLDKTVEREGPLAAERVAALGVDMLSVLTEAHALGIVHRDVKPANVLVRQDGSVKLADFGIARFHGDPTLTDAGAILGTPASMAPEQIRGRDSSPATDLWGLGVTLFHAVEGRPAFDGPTPTAAMAAVLTDPPRTPQRAGEPLGPLLLSLLAKDPQDRPTAAQVRTELSHLTSAG